MIETLVGTLFGGLFRLAPEILKWMDRKDERKHELSMFDKQLDADKLKAASAQQLADIEANKGIGIAEIQALVEGVRAQSTQTGVKWVDALNSLVRPILTFYWCIALYTGALVAQYLALIGEGQTNTAAILSIFGPQEKAIVASMMSYWFLDRTLRRK